jgi:NAD(P)-dependent dehydrogenase (short-subunit alcohol dehydrogenase family)
VRAQRAVYDGADMPKVDAVCGLIAATLEKYGRVDILVNNADIQSTAPSRSVFHLNIPWMNLHRESVSYNNISASAVPV